MDLNVFFRKMDAMIKARDIKGAEQLATDSLIKAQQSEDLPAVVAISNELGGIYRVTNRFEEGKAVYQSALDSLEKLGMKNSLQYGTTLLNLAGVYSESKSNTEALQLYLQAAGIFEKENLGKDYRTAALYNNISRVYDQLHQEDKAIESAEKALEIIKEIPDSRIELATTHTTLAVIYLKQGHYGKAENHLLDAERIFLAEGGKVDGHYASTLAALGNLYYSKKDYSRAVGYFEQALNLIKQIYGENSAFQTVKGDLEQARRLLDGASMSGSGPAASEISRQADTRMSGLALSEAYYNAYGKAMLEEQFPEYMQYAAVGLVGEGSECLGFDDEISEDHDFGPGFCIWLPEDIYQKAGFRIQSAYDALPKIFKKKTRLETAEGHGRVGVFSIQGFYKRYIGKIPKTNVDWLVIPEANLCTATSGKVFSDPYGRFTSYRNELLQFYPRDVFLKKLVARLAVMSQSGQYNYERCMKRGYYAPAYIACGEFTKAAVSAVYLLNGRYMPFYKWMFRGMDELPVLHEVKQMLEQLTSTADLPENTENKVQLIEEICILIRKELNRQGISNETDNFLKSHCMPIMHTISDAQIRNLPLLYDPKQQ